MHAINIYFIHSFCTWLINSPKVLLFIHYSKMCSLTVSSLCFSPLKRPYGHYLSIYYPSMHFNWRNSGFGTGSTATSPLPVVSRPSSHHHHAVRKCSCCTRYPPPTSPDTKKLYFPLFPWKCWRPHWTELGATWFSARCPEGGTGWPLKVLSSPNHSMILWFSLLLLMLIFILYKACCVRSRSVIPKLTMYLSNHTH